MRGILSDNKAYEISGWAREWRRWRNRDRNTFPLSTHRCWHTTGPEALPIDVPHDKGNKKKASKGGAKQFCLLWEDDIPPLLLSMATLRRKGKVQWDTGPCASWSCRTESRGVILNLQHHPSERRHVFPQMNDLNQKTSPVARDTYGHHSQEQLSSTSPAHFPLCNVRGCSVKRMTL